MGVGEGVMDGCGTEVSPTRCLRVRTEGDFFFWGSSGLGSLSLSPEEAERPWLPLPLTPPTLPPPPAPLMAAARLLLSGDPPFTFLGASAGLEGVRMGVGPPFLVVGGVAEAVRGLGEIRC